MFCAMLLGLIPILGGGLAFAGMMRVSLKALRGQIPEPADGFAGLSDNAIDHIVMGLLQIVGMLACCVGVYVSQGIFFPGTMLILDTRHDLGAGQGRLLERREANWVRLDALRAGGRPGRRARARSCAAWASSSPRPSP